MALFPGKMRAGGVTLLLGLALIHVSLAGTIQNNTEEEPRALEDVVEPPVLKDGGEPKALEDGVEAAVLKDGGETKVLEDGGEPKALEDGVETAVLEEGVEPAVLEDGGQLKELADGVVSVTGYIFDGDKIFAEKADSIIKYSAEVMKGCTTDECRYYTYCNKVGYDIVCLDIRLTNSTDLAEEFREDVTLESDKVLKDGYIFDNDETFAEMMNSLLEYSHQVMKECSSRNCRYYKFCTKVGNDIVCLSIKLIPDKSADLLNEEDEGDTAGEDSFYLQSGYIFDDDEIFAEKSQSLLKYSAKVMGTCDTKHCRNYMLCNRVGYDIICLTVELFRGEDELLDEILGYIHVDEPDDGDEMDNLEFINTEPEENDELLDGEDSNDEIKAQIIENKEDEEDTPKEDLAEDKVEDTLPA